MKVGNATEKEGKIMKVVSLNKYENGKTRAFATVSIFGVAVSGIRLVEMAKDDWKIEMPSAKGKDGKYYNTVWIDLGNKEDNKEIYNQLTELVYKEYKKK
jgi:translation elongation factor P/translation initiation factor 5A